MPPELTGVQHLPELAVIPIDNIPILVPPPAEPMAIPAEVEFEGAAEVIRAVFAIFGG